LLEYREEFCQRLRLLPSVKVIQGDIQLRTPFESGSFDRVVAIHVLEHLRDLPPAIDEIERVLASGGIFDVVLPCRDRRLLLARKLSAERLFHRRFKCHTGRSSPTNTSIRSSKYCRF